MSLRTEIQSAIDEVAPPTFGLPERVVQTVLAEGPSRRRRERLMLRLRVPLSLVAVFVAIALVVGILIGGRLVQNWHSFHNPAPAAGARAALIQLESRPLVLPTPASTVDCKSGPYNSLGSFGSGPVYSDERATSITNWGYYFHNFAYAQTNIDGPILIRVNDLFTHQPVVFVGQFAAGPVVGGDTVDGVAFDQHTELVFDTRHALTSSGPHTFAWRFTAGVPKSWSGSTGWQIDGVGFSEVFVAC